MTLLFKALLTVLLLLPGGFIAVPLLLWLVQRFWPSSSASSLTDSFAIRALSSLRR